MSHGFKVDALVLKCRGYMSPEYINKGIVSTKSDIFSLGVIIIEIVTGRRDYPDDTGTPSEKFIEIVRKLYFDFQGRVAFLREIVLLFASW